MTLSSDSAYNHSASPNQESTYSTSLPSKTKYKRFPRYLRCVFLVVISSYGRAEAVEPLPLTPKLTRS
ncbi:hypothetical protein NXS19_005734 [Fusarium pseudograminearum]|nr:hypothetical protein NXS19_005734 [Fusarium pseudograminearum]